MFVSSRALLGRPAHLFVGRRWIPGEDKAHRSGWAVYTLEIPTGYRIEERFLKDLVGFGIVRNLRDAENYPNSLNFIFEFVSPSRSHSPPLLRHSMFISVGSSTRHRSVGSSNSNVTFLWLI